LIISFFSRTHPPSPSLMNYRGGAIMYYVIEY
jgi:hypothetical protein